MLFGCYRKGEANDPEIYTAAIAATLAEFTDDVVEFVTDPRTGLPATCKWLPTVAEVREACKKRAEAVENIKILHERGYTQTADGRWKKAE